MSRIALAAATALVLMGAASTASADVQMSIKGGRVTIVAKDATIRQILTEWARLGQTKIVNVERIPGGPVTLELNDVTEQQALRVLLRSVGGYVTAPRLTAAADASVFDRIVVMPVTPQAPSSAPAAAPPPAFQSFQPPQQQFPIDDDRDEPPQAQPQPVNRSPVFVFPQPPAGGNAQPQNVMPQPQPGPPARPAFGAFPGAPTGNVPTGVSVPGMVVPAPQPPPGQPGASGQPFQPVQPFQPAPSR